MFCTLQEAYNVPSFDAKRAPACVVPSRATADPYDPYFPETGKGERAAYASVRPRVQEGFVSNEAPSSSQMGLREKVTYRAQGADYDYYCKTFGICGPKVETFEDAQVPAQKKDTAAKEKKPSRCVNGPLSYQVPISDKAKAQYDEALKASLTQQDTEGLPERPQMRKADMEGVSGYYDEELEQYLQTKDMKGSVLVPPTPLPKHDLQAQPYDPSESPFRKAMLEYQDQTPSSPAPLVAPSTAASAPTNPWENIWDIAMFAAAGFLILLLCEQLFKLAVMIGMRKTVDLLEPFLLQLKTANSAVA